VVKQLGATAEGVVRPGVPYQAALVGAGCLIAVGLVAVVQVLHLGELMDPDRPLTAGHADRLVICYALAVLALVAAATFLPERHLWLPVAGAALLASIAIAATLLLGGELWSFIWAALTMAACWRVGRWLLDAGGTPALVGEPAVAWLAGAGAIAIALLLIGVAGLLSWWTAGAPILVLGLAGGIALVGSLGPHGARAAWSALASTRLAAASASLCLLTAGLASVWAAAPELMFDALYFKAWLPSEWARTGEIAPLVLHPYLNVSGFAQIIAIPGHAAGADGVGRYMQWLALGALVATVWSVARRSPWAPVAAAALALTPLLFWQATTAYDDAILALAGVAMGVAVLAALRAPEDSVAALGGALGALAGVCLGLKLHLAPLAAGLVLGWLLMRGRHRWGTAALSAAGGGLLTAAPLLVVRWIEVGNPVLPFLNNVFESPHWPALEGGVNVSPLSLAAAAGALALALFALSRGWDRAIRLGLAGLVLAGVLVLLVSPSAVTNVLNVPGSDNPASALWLTLADPLQLGISVPVGAFGLLSVAVTLAVLICWRAAPDVGGVPSLWLGVVVGAAMWYAQFRDPRYLLPTGAVAVLAIALSSGVRPLGPRLQVAGLTGLAAMAILLWPSTLSQFWNVPGKGIPLRAALGLTDEREYERQSTPERDLLASFDHVAPPGALAAADPHQRIWLTEGRDLTPFWELHRRLEIGGAAPDDPAATLAAVRAAGVSWVLTRRPSSFVDLSALSSFPYLERMVEVFGRPVWSSSAGTLYELPDGPDGGE
jgi:hypothetical protein